MALLEHTQLQDVGTDGSAHRWEESKQTAKTSHWQKVINRLTSYLQRSELVAASEAKELEQQPSL
jgi:hypothetical protein